MGKNAAMATFEDRLDSLKDSVRDLVDYGSDRAGALKDRMIDVKDTVVSGTKTGVSKAGSLIKEHPIIAVAIALGVGYFAIRLARR